MPSGRLINVSPTTPLEKRVWARCAKRPMHPAYAREYLEEVSRIDNDYAQFRPIYENAEAHRAYTELDEWFFHYDRGHDWQLEEYARKLNRIRRRYAERGPTGDELFNLIFGNG